MTAAPPYEPPRRRVWPMPVLVSWRRFGLAVICASSIIAAVGLVLYVRDATPSLQPPAVPQSAAFFEKAAGTIDADKSAGVRLVVDQFVEALERQKEADMRRLFPAMTGREARILLAIRERLGDGAELRAEPERTTSAAGNAVQVDFVIRARQSGGDRERRLPFTATVSYDSGSWRIVQLR